MRPTTCSRLLFATLASAVIFAAGCQSYVNSPRGVAMRKAKAAEFSHPLIARAYNAKPAIRFPAVIGLAAMDARTQTHLRNLDAFDKLDGLKSLPHVKDTVSVNSLVMANSDSELAGPDGKPTPIWNKSDVIVREAAAKLHADAVLMMIVETTVTDGKIFAPFTLLTLGMFPNDRSEVIATALAALVDTRTGYVYATVERSAGKTCHAMSWDDDTRERTVENASRRAMEKLLGEFPAVWRGVVAKHRP
jgi:hypothetical protein